VTWRKGESGNPAGRPPGLGDVGRLRAELYSRLPAVLEAAIRAAVGGDVAAMRLVLERTIPPLRPEEMPIALGEGFAGNKAELIAVIVQALADGRIDTSRGGRLIALLTPSELEERIDRYEKRYENMLDGK
jgi:hypothetical protein